MCGDSSASQNLALLEKNCGYATGGEAAYYF
jgi:hypothetical protein